VLDFDVSEFKDEFKIHNWAAATGDSVVDKKMTLSQTRLIRLLMDGFWTHFEKTIASHAGQAYSAVEATVEGSSVSSSSSSKQSSGRTSLSGRSSKRLRDRGGDGSDNDGGRNPKRGAQLSKNDNVGMKYACPYRKRNPRKYSVQTWPRCVLSPHTSVARVK
jgi:hypothetical protein